MRIVLDNDRVVNVPSDGPLPIIEDLSCWECGNTLHPDDALPVEIDFGGAPLRVPMCSICAPSEQVA
jgi:hypothetical protein